MPWRRRARPAKPNDVPLQAGCGARLAAAAGFSGLSDQISIRRSPRPLHTDLTEIPAGGAAVLLVPANPRRRVLALSTDSGTVFFGFSPAVDAGSGYSLGGSYEWRPGAAPGGAVYAFSVSATSVLIKEQTDPVAF